MWFLSPKHCYIYCRGLLQKPNHKSNLKALCKMQSSWMFTIIFIWKVLSVCRILWLFVRCWYPCFYLTVRDFSKISWEAKFWRHLISKMWPLWKKASSNVIYGMKWQFVIILGKCSFLCQNTTRQSLYDDRWNPTATRKNDATHMKCRFEDRAAGLAAEYLPSMHKALDSILRTGKKNEWL